MPSPFEALPLPLTPAEPDSAFAQDLRPASSGRSTRRRLHHGIVPTQARPTPFLAFVRPLAALMEKWSALGLRTANLALCADLSG